MYIMHLCQENQPPSYLQYCVIHGIMYRMIDGDTLQELFENLASELRRGVLVLAVLQECHQLQYGYSLKQRLAEAGLDMSEGTLYPLLRRLESQGLLESEWQLIGDQRPRRYYKLSALGAEVLAQLDIEWKRLIAVLRQLGIGGNGNHGSH